MARRRPVRRVRAHRSAVVLNINGSPYHHGKGEERLEICRDRARQTGAWFVYVNAVGGQDELVFDGGSMVVSPDGQVVARAAMFDEDLVFFELQDLEGGGAGRSRPDAAGLADRPRGGLPALVLGLGDYVRKNGFPRSSSGCPGGIDSALVATLAADALGPEAVRLLAMPSEYSSAESAEDAVECANVWASGSTSCRSRTCSTRIAGRWRACSPGPRRTWPRRTCRRASAATC